MKKIMIGLALGIVLCGAAYFLTIPQVKQAEYDRGYNDGNKKGITAGTTAGIAQGVADMQAQQKQIHERDSIAMVQKQHELAMQKAAAKPKKVVKEIQNWHVIDGKIGDPVVGQEPAPAAPTNTPDSN